MMVRPSHCMHRARDMRFADHAAPSGSLRPSRGMPTDSNVQQPYANDTSSAALQQPQIILLREGTDTSQGKPQLISNINACVTVVDAVRTTLGPRGMDKLVIDDRVSLPSGRASMCWLTLALLRPRICCL